MQRILPNVRKGIEKLIIMISAHSDKVSLFQALTFLCQICMAKRCVQISKNKGQTEKYSTVSSLPVSLTSYSLECLCWAQQNWSGSQPWGLSGCSRWFSGTWPLTSVVWVAEDSGSQNIWAKWWEKGCSPHSSDWQNLSPPSRFAPAWCHSCWSFSFCLSPLEDWSTQSFGSYNSHSPYLDAWTWQLWRSWLLRASQR